MCCDETLLWTCLPLSGYLVRTCQSYEDVRYIALDGLSDQLSAGMALDHVRYTQVWECHKVRAEKEIQEVKDRTMSQL